MTKKSKYYFCYSKNLSNLLSRHGIYYITKARSMRDSGIFTLYERTEELEKVLGIGAENKWSNPATNFTDSKN